MEEAALLEQSVANDGGLLANSWFWVAALFFWVWSYASIHGAPRRLARIAAKEPEAARLAYDFMRYRLGRGRILPLGLAPFRWPMIGGALGYAVVHAALGAPETLIIAAALAPVMILDVTMEPRALAAIEARRAAQGDQWTAFGETLAELTRAKTASVMIAFALTLLAAAALG